MTTHDRDNIIAAAKAADEDFTGDTSFNLGDSIVGINAIERFYAIAFEAGRNSVDTPVALAEAYRCGEEAGRVAEREDCAKVCDTDWNGDADTYAYSEAANECADAIRARGTSK